MKFPNIKIEKKPAQLIETTFPRWLFSKEYICLENSSCLTEADSIFALPAQKNDGSNWSSDEIVLTSRNLRLVHSNQNYERTITYIESDNGVNFTASELIFKVNKILPRENGLYGSFQMRLWGYPVFGTNSKPPIYVCLTD